MFKRDRREQVQIMISQQYNQPMSSIIDGLIQIRINDQRKPFNAAQKPSFIYQFAKRVNNNNGCLFFDKSQRHTKFSTQVELQDREFLVQIRSDQNRKDMTISASELEKSCFKKTDSKHNEISIMKTLSNHLFSVPNEAVYYIYQGKITMKLKLHISNIDAYSTRMVETYNQILHKRIKHFHQFLVKFFKSEKTVISQLQKDGQFNEDLAIALILNKTEANFDFTEEKHQPKINPSVLKRQKAQLKIIEDNIVSQRNLQKNVDFLYLFKRKQCTSSWLKSNLSHVSEIHQRRHKNSLQINFLEERPADELVHNRIKADIKDRMSKPIAEGGSSFIYLAKMIVTYPMNHPMCAGKKTEEKVEKLMAVKTLKPELEKRLKEKLTHEKAIVEKLSGESSHFIPKYYSIEKQSQLSNFLLMQYLNGQQLDNFVKIRNQTLSLRTKIYILFNIIFGMGYLINNQIVHLDLKPINIIICKHLIPKIIDFGQAYHRDVCPKYYCPGFTFPYVAPQVYTKYENHFTHKREEEIAYSEKQDVFAFGVIMYELLFNSKIFNFNNSKYKEVYYNNLIMERILLSPQKLSSYGDGFVMSALAYMIGQCLNRQPQKRPKFNWIGVFFKVILNFYKTH